MVSRGKYGQNGWYTMLTLLTVMTRNAIITNHNEYIVTINYTTHKTYEKYSLVLIGG